MIRKILNYLFPNFSCLGCEREINKSVLDHVCDDCVSKFQPADESVVDVFAPFWYETPVSDMVLKLKYSADGQVATTMAMFMENTIKGLEFDLLIPIPLSKSRLRERGYNQAEVLAKEISKITNIPVAGDLVVRTRATIPQTNMTDSERRENQSGSFAVVFEKAPIVNGARILLIDDVYTSGATTNEVKKVLLENNAKSVAGLFIARAKRFEET